MAGITADFFTVAGAACANLENSGVITAVFPATAAETAGPAIYTVSVTGGTASVTSGAAGTSVTLAAGTAPEGKRFKEWRVVSGGVTITGNTFTIGAADVVIEAVWEDIPAGGLSGGAIASIVIGVTAAAGIAGFCVSVLDKEKENGVNKKHPV